MRCRSHCSRSRRVVMAWAGRHFYTRAWAAFRHRTADMNTLVAVGTGAAFLYSVVATLAPAFFISARRGARPLLRGGDHHHRAHPHRQRARGAREAADVRRRCARWSSCSRRRRASCATTAASVDVPVERRRAGDVIVVRPGERMPVDGEVVSGRERGRRIDAHRRIDAGGRSAPAIASSAGRSTAPARSATAPRRSAPTACSRRSSS